MLFPGFAAAPARPPHRAQFRAAVELLPRPETPPAIRSEAECSPNIFAASTDCAPAASCPKRMRRSRCCFFLYYLLPQGRGQLVGGSISATLSRETRPLRAGPGQPKLGRFQVLRDQLGAIRFSLHQLLQLLGELKAGVQPECTFSIPPSPPEFVPVRAGRAPFHRSLAPSDGSGCA